MKNVPAEHAAVDSAYNNGIRLFEQLRMFALDRQERAKDDQEWSRFIDDLRAKKTFMPSHLPSLKVLSADDIEEQPDWQFAPIVVGGNEERAHLNNIGVRNFALKTGVGIVAWKNQIKQDENTKELDPEQRDALFTDPRLVTLFATGAPAYLNENISPNANRKGNRSNAEALSTIRFKCRVTNASLFCNRCL